MAPRKTRTSLKPKDVAPDKLAKFRISDETEEVKYNGVKWRVLDRRGVFLALSRGHGQREEFLWLHEACVTPIVTKVKRVAKPKAKPKRVAKAKVPPPSKAPKGKKAKKVISTTPPKSPKRGGKKVKVSARR